MATDNPGPTAAPSKEQQILQIIQLALAALQAIPMTAIGAAAASAFLAIFQNAAALYEQQTGKPFDVTKIPLETPVP